MIDRYRLEVLVSQTGHAELWRAHDTALDRSVALRLIPADDPRAPHVVAAARRAAGVDDRRIIAVLDVLDLVTDEHDRATYAAVVSEWVDGRTLTDIQEEREGEPIDVSEALPLVRQVALAIQHSHEVGVQHDRLRPSSLLIAETADLDDPFTLLGDSNVVRVRGLAVDAALWPEASPDVRDSDLHGVGCLFYAILTGRWPEGLTDGMSPAPRVGGRLLPPSQVVAEVPHAVDDLVMRAIDPTVTADDRWSPFADVSEFVTALGGLDATSSRWSFALPPTRPDSVGRRILRGVGRTAVAAVALLAIGGLALGGVRLAQGADSPWGVSPTPMATEVLMDVAVGEDPLLGTDTPTGEIAIVAVTDFDPRGGDGVEMPDLVDGAIDGDPATAWTTDIYYSADLDGKKGVGLLLDLGVSEAVSAVQLEFLGSGGSVKVLMAPEPYGKVSKWTPLASARGVGTSIDLRSPRPVVGRYVLVWFTQLPLVDEYYQGGIKEVSVLR
jgi:hypothetical protein